MFPRFLPIKTLSASIVLFLLSFIAVAQSTSVISGVVTDPNGRPLPYVSVVATFQQKEVDGALSDSLGRYELKVGQSQTPYQLLFTYMGCETQSIEILVNAKKVSVPTVAMRYSSEMLSGITVAGQQEPMTMNVQHATYTPNSQSASVKGSVLDVLKEAAAVTVDNEGNISLRLDFKPIKGMDIQLQYFLTTPQYFPQFTTGLCHYMNAGISQKFLKNSLTVSILLTDVFGTDQWNIHSDNRVYRLSHLSVDESPMLWLGISYNFNSFRDGKASQPAGEEQKGRLRFGL